VVRADGAQPNSAPARAEAWKRLDALHHDSESSHYDELIGREFEVYQDTYTAGRWARLLVQRGASTVLDVGCGTGRTGLAIAASGPGLIGVDMSRGMLRRAREKAIRLGLDDVLWVQADAECLPLQAGAIDGVVCQGVLHHLPDIGSALAEMERVVDPEGAILLAEPSQPGSRIHALVRRLARGLVAAKRVAEGFGLRESPAAENERPLEVSDVTRPLLRSGWDLAITHLVHPPIVYRWLPLPLARLAVLALNRGGMGHPDPADIAVVDAVGRRTAPGGRA